MQRFSKIKGHNYLQPDFLINLPVNSLTITYAAIQLN